MKVVQETLGGIRVVKAFGQEDREKERFTGKASESLRAKIRLSFQEGGLGLMLGLVRFSTSVAENIAYANPDAASEEIVAAARAANAHEFSTNLPEGYDTQVGERGMRLSGGERQRISLARAFLKNAPILILDEPTSSVDVKTEALIMEAMTRLMRGCTTFMIAHRLSTLEKCGVRLAIEHGRLLDTMVITAEKGDSNDH